MAEGFLKRFNCRCYKFPVIGSCSKKNYKDISRNLPFAVQSLNHILTRKIGNRKKIILFGPM
ncbi:MAG: hypothetical protein C4539_09265 [Ignavibacteriales bacterium]|nr:MAG: hypothetical protein C4539_09265 [Ignavibacteriales bacterium]